MRQITKLADRNVRPTFRRASWKLVGISFLGVLLACSCPFTATSNSVSTLILTATPVPQAASSACNGAHPHCYAVTRYQNDRLAGGHVAIGGEQLNCTATDCTNPCVAGDCTTDGDFIDNEMWLGDDTDPQQATWVEAGYGTFHFNNQILTYSFWGDKRYPVAGRTDCVGSGIFVIYPIAPITPGQPANVAITHTTGPTNGYNISFTGNGSRAGSDTALHSEQNCMQAKYLEIGEETYGDRHALSSSAGTDFTNATYTNTAGAATSVPDSGADVTLLNDAPPSGYWDSGVFRVRQCCT